MLRELRWWADLLDARFRIPGTQIRFGLDPILSLMPGLGRAGVADVHRAAAGAGRATARPEGGARPHGGQRAARRAHRRDSDPRQRRRHFLASQHRQPAVARAPRPAGRPPATSDYVFVWAMAAILGLLVVVPVVSESVAGHLTLLLDRPVASISTPAPSTAPSTQHPMLVSDFDFDLARGADCAGAAAARPGAAARRSP